LHEGSAHRETLGFPLYFVIIGINVLIFMKLGVNVMSLETISSWYNMI